MTEVVKAFQKHGFGFTKASTDSCSATALSASPAALHVTLSSYSQVFLGYISPILRALALTSPPPRSVDFSRQEYESGLPCPSPGGLPDPGIEPASFVSCIHRGVLFWRQMLHASTYMLLSHFSRVRLCVTP